MSERAEIHFAISEVAERRNSRGNIFGTILTCAPDVVIEDGGSTRVYASGIIRVREEFTDRVRSTLANLDCYEV